MNTVSAWSASVSPAIPWGEGVSRLEENLTIDTPKASKLADSLRVPETDFIARTLPEAEFNAFATALDDRLSSTSTTAEEVAEFIDETRGGLEQ